MDQNEKLVMYGVTYELARDDYSGKITAGAVMPRNNNLIIYDKVYRSTVLTYGLLSIVHARETEGGWGEPALLSHIGK